jgi:FdhD protein
MSKVTTTPVQRYVFGTNGTDGPDLLAVEEPLEIRLGYGPATDRQQRNLTVTMRTPGADFELALGFLFTEGLIESAADVRSIQYCTDLGRSQTGNTVRVELRPEVPFDGTRLERHFYTTSSCGVCGKTSIEAVRERIRAVPTSSFQVSDSVLYQLPERLRVRQDGFAHTGGLHAAGLFDAAGTLCLLREDVGRHNALDKLIGAALQRGWVPLTEYLVVVSSRASFELIQKASTAGVPLLAAVGAPTSLAVELAQQTGLTLVGFLREQRFNLYTHPERVGL